MDERKPPPEGLREEDQAVWENYLDREGLAGEKPREKEDFAALLDEDAPEQTEEQAARDAPEQTLATPPPRPRRRQPKKKAKTGEIHIDARLDLHRMTQQEAYDALKDFIAEAWERNAQCVLVITGKGKISNPEKDDNWHDDRKGILREQFPRWMETEQFSRYVRETAVARPKDGGEGAYYVYLRPKP